MCLRFLLFPRCPCFPPFFGEGLVCGCWPPVYLTLPSLHPSRTSAVLLGLHPTPFLYSSHISSTWDLCGLACSPQPLLWPLLPSFPVAGGGLTPTPHLLTQVLFLCCFLAPKFHLSLHLSWPPSDQALPTLLIAAACGLLFMCLLLPTTRKEAGIWFPDSSWDLSTAWGQATLISEGICCHSVYLRVL